MSNGSAIFLILLLSLITTKCRGIERMLEKLDVTLAEAKFSRYSRQDKFAKDSSLIWQEYEFETGAGNREELTITNVSIEKYGNLPETEVKWQFLEVGGSGYLASTERSTLSFYKLNDDKILVDNPVSLNADGIILTFKVVAIKNNLRAQEGVSRNEILAVLYVESNSETSLQWFRLLENEFHFFWSWPVQRHIKDMEFIQHGDKNKLLLLDSEGVNFEEEYSLIDVYGFNINFSNIGLNRMWLCQSTSVPKTFDIQICRIYESILLALHGANGVFLYQYTDTAVEGGLFHELPTIKAQDLRNFICFESGYIQYLAVSGREAGLYSFFENEFQYDTESGQNFEVSEVSWIKDIKLNTYRDESLLLVQLKNSTVIALAWQGARFKTVNLPSKILEQFDISKITVIPRLGFVSGNRFVRFDTELKGVRRPSHGETEGMISTQALLDIVFRDQESVINDTNERIEKSYLKNPVITGFWDIKSVNATRTTVKENITYHFIAIGSTDLTVEDWRYNLSTYTKIFNSFEKKLNETNLNLKQAVDAKLSDVHLESDLEISGSINIKGTLNADKFTAEYINDISISVGPNHSLKDDVEIIIDSEIFDSMRTENLRIMSLNGINPNDIFLENSKKSFDNVDFSKIKRLVVDGHLTAPILNEYVWETLIRNVVWKDKPAIISGSTVVEGALVADGVKVEIINDIPYPSGYILQNSTTSVNMLAYKAFDKLSVTNSLNLNTLNGIDINDFILVHENNALSEEITFEDLIVDEALQIDKDVVGLNADRVVYLNETTNFTSNIAISRLTVLGDIILENSIGDKSLLNFEDLLLRTDEDVEITGSKTFLGGVELLSNVTITSNTINGHRTDEFITLDTEQEFLNLEKISANVSFAEVDHGGIRKLEDLLKESYKQSGAANCLQKIIIFKYPIAVDKLSFNTLRNNVSEKEFQRKLSETFQRVQFESITTSNLEAEEITARIVNGVDFSKLVERLTAPHIVDDRTIGNVDISSLRAKSINNVPLDELSLLKDQADSLNKKIHNDDISLESLHVTGTIDVASINGIILSDIHKEKQMGTVIFEENVSIENLTVLGTMNGFNFSEHVNDAIFKTDRDIVVNGHKTFDSINCQYLETSKLNGHLMENILDSTKEQTLTGPVVIKGSVNVLKNFDTEGKVGNVLYHTLTERFKLLDNNTYQLRGDLEFTNDVSIKSLHTDGLIQGALFDNFLRTTISKREDRVTISGAKIFKDSVTFNGPVTVQDVLNGLDLRKFYETALYIDKDFSVETMIIFRSGISVENDIIVLNDLKTNTIMGVNMTKLKASIIYLDRPTYITDLMTFSSATFESNIKVDKINDVDMQLLIPLNTEQTLFVDVLKCTNVTAEGIKISGKVNGHELNAIYKNTFMLFGDQNVSGVMNFYGNVYARKNFNTHLINGIKPKQIILLNAGETLTGNFVFKNQVVLDRSLRVLGNINNISIDRWLAVVRTSSSLKQIISGQWTVHGNVYVENRITYNGILNGVNVSELSDLVARNDLEMDGIITEAKMNLQNICDDLHHLKKFAENQIYKFNAFDYLQVLEFDQNIVSVHYFELEDLDYLLVSYDTCHMNAFLFTGEKFVLVANVPNFGAIDDWATFEFNEVLYFVTIGGNTCGRSPGNLWKLENDEFTHVLSLGNLTDKRHITHETFLGMVNSDIEKRSIEQSNEKPKKYASYEATGDDSKYVLKDDRLLLASRHLIYEHVNEHKSIKNLGDYIGYTSLSFKAGRTEKEHFLYYDEDISENYIFVCNDETSYKKILQTIESHKPSSFLIINFESLAETLLIFVENGRNLRIYEYRGIEGFVYKDSIRIDVEKLFNFKLRKSSNLVKRNCLALISGKRLTLLEAKMYGEKLDMRPLSCVNN